MKPKGVIAQVGLAACVSLSAWSIASADEPAPKARGLINRILHRETPASDDIAVRRLFNDSGDDSADSGGPSELSRRLQTAQATPIPAPPPPDKAAATPDKPAAKSENGCTSEKKEEEKKEEEAKPEEEKGLLMQLFDKHCCGLKDSKIKVYGWLQQGFTANFDAPENRLNFGRLFDDRSNDYRFNQLMLFMERPVEKGDKYDFGFMVNLLYGTDGRFIHAVDLLDNTFNEPVQFDPLQFYGMVHLPWLTKNGMDLEVGRFVTLMGYEVIAATGDPLYSHSYIFNFGIPFTHTGAMLHTYLGDNWVLKTGIVNGINTFGDNNDSVAFHGGLNYVPEKGKLNWYNSVHMGPENVDNNDDGRYIFSSQPVIKWNDKLTEAMDFNLGLDSVNTSIATHQEWYAVAHYLLYALSEKVTAICRFEWFRDDDGFVVAAFTTNDAFANVLRGSPNKPGAVLPGGATSYFELTLGLNWKPCKDLIIRPEARWDWSADSTVAPFDDFSDANMFTLGCDVIWTF